jgi:release factor glutamine methyltransferase
VTDYKPMMDPAGVEWIRWWHERALAEGAALAAAEPVRTFDYLGLTLVIPAEVQPIFPVSHLLGEAVLAEARPGDRVLDMGTGSGVNGILAATRGARVVAVDVNPYALDAARANADRNGVADRVDVRGSDVFAGIDGEFDLIVFDPPYRWFTPRDVRELASTDENYRALTEFFAQARRHLSPAGRMLIAFGTSGDIAYLRRLMTINGFIATVVASLAGDREGVPVEYFTFRVTPETHTASG